MKQYDNDICSHMHTYTAEIANRPSQVVVVLPFGAKTQKSIYIISHCELHDEMILIWHHSSRTGMDEF